MVLLSVESEGGAMLTYRLGKSQISVGSGSRNDVVVRSPGVGERHLVIHRNGEVHTFVTVDRQVVVLNGERRSRGVLNPGDRLRIGSITLTFRGSNSGQVDLVEEQEASPSPSLRPAATHGESAVEVVADPAGLGEVRSKLLELFAEPRGDFLQRVVALVREARGEVELALVVPGDGEVPVPLASVWSGDLPKVPGRYLTDLLTPGRYLVISEKGHSVVGFAVVTPGRDIPAILLVRPAAVLGAEDLALLGELTRLLGLYWKDVERKDSSFSGWELQARHRLEAVLPGSSQAVQVLRTGMLAAAGSREPVLICGAPGVGRTEVARILATLGPVGGRPVVVFEGRAGDPEGLRQELFGLSGRPTLGNDPDGILAQARGGVLVIRNADLLPLSLQRELTGLIGAQQREPLSSVSIRWVVTCGEDPLALVQTGKLSSELFMAFSHRMLRVPRLEDRREDLPLLIGALLRRVAQEQQKKVRGITLECLNALLARPFPGEMGELVGEMNRIVTATPDGEMVRCDSTDSAHPAMTAGQGAGAEGAALLCSDNLKEVVPQVEQMLINRVMRKVKGNQSKGARLLGISRGALIAKIKEYNIADFRYLRRRRG